MQKSIVDLRCRRTNSDQFIHNGQICWIMGDYMVIRGLGRIKYMDESGKSKLLFGDENTLVDVIEDFPNV